MNMASTGRTGRQGAWLRVALLTGTLLLGGCSDDLDELQAQVDEIRSAPGTGIEPLPEVKPYETFDYAAGEERSPFEPGMSPGANAPNAIRSARSPSRTDSENGT